jgi:hypothetical protein
MSTALNLRKVHKFSIVAPRLPKPKRPLTEVCQRCGRMRQIASAIPVFCPDNFDDDGHVFGHTEYVGICARCARKVNR